MKTLGNKTLGVFQFIPILFQMMGSNILRGSPITSSKALTIFNPRRAKPTFSKLPSTHNSLPTSLFSKTHFRISSLKPQTVGFGDSFCENRRILHSGSVVAMAALGSVQKSEEEWQAILSPEQFRILRQKGTE